MSHEIDASHTFCQCFKKYLNILGLQREIFCWNNVCHYFGHFVIVGKWIYFLKKPLHSPKRKLTSLIGWLCLLLLLALEMWWCHHRNLTEKNSPLYFAPFYVSSSPPSCSWGWNLDIKLHMQCCLKAQGRRNCNLAAAAAATAAPHLFLTPPFISRINALVATRGQPY